MSKQEKEENKSPEDTENECTSSAEVSIEDKQATGESKSPKDTKNECTSSAVVSIEDKQATGESKSPENTKNERTSSAVVSIEDKQATGESFETASYKSTGADDAVKEGTVSFQGEKEADPICFVKGVQNKKILQELTGKQLIKYERPRFWLYEGWFSNLTSASNQAPSASSASSYWPTLPWPFSSPEETRAAAERVTTTAATTSIFDYLPVGISAPQKKIPKGPSILEYGHFPSSRALNYPNKEKDIRNKILQPTFALLLGMIFVVFTCLVIISQTPLKDDLFSLVGFISAGACMFVIFLQYFGFCLFSFSHSFPVNYALLLITAACFGWVVSVFTLSLVPNIVIGAVATIFVVFSFCFLLSYTRVDFRKRSYLLVFLFFDVLVGALISLILMSFHPRFQWYKAIPMVGSTIPVLIMMLVELKMALDNRSYELGEGEHAYLAFLVFTCYIDLVIQALHRMIIKIRECADKLHDRLGLKD